MARRTTDYVKLGLFVLTGLVLIIIVLYTLSRNQSIFNPRFEVLVHFSDVGGLVPGNNVRLNGIVVGSVKSIQLLNDTVVEVRLSIDNTMRGIIRKNAHATVNTDGLIGNRVVDLLPDKSPAEAVAPGDRIASRPSIDTDDMLRTLAETNRNVLALSLDLRETVRNINESAQLNALLNDVSISADLKNTLNNLRRASEEAVGLMRNLNAGVNEALEGQGTVGTLVNDTTLAHELRQVVTQIQALEAQAGKAVAGIDAFVQTLDKDLYEGGGPAHLLLRDTVSAVAIQHSLVTLERSTVLLEENLEAMRHSFPFKKYFKKQEKEAKKGGE